MRPLTAFDIVLRIGLFGVALAVGIAAPAIHAATVDPDIAACDDVKDWNARIAGCSRLLARQKWPAKAQAQFYLQRAEGYVNLKQLQNARPDLEASVKLDPTNAVAQGEFSFVLTQLGDADRAIQSADQALRLNPNYGLAYIARAAALIQKGRLDEAIDAITRSITLNPKLPSNYLIRANAFAGKGDSDRALSDLDTFISLAPQEANGYNNRCWVLTAKGDLDNALTDCNQALKLDPNHALSYSNRGIIFFQKGDLDHALADFGQAIRLDPTYWAPFTGRGDVWRKRGDLGRALADYREAIRIAPRAARSYVSEGLVFEAQGQIDQARAAFKTAIDLPMTIGVTGAQGAIVESFKREQDTARARLVALGGDTSTMPAGPLFNNKVPPPAASSVAPATQQVLGRRIALVIGNGAYLNAPQLINPPNDARLIAKSLHDMGFEVSDGVNLDRAAMTKLIGDFLRAAATANTAVLYYAGHGVQIDGQNYLLPVDVKFTGVSDFTSEMTEVSTILAGLDDGIRANVVILDACRDNPLVQQTAQPASASRAITVPTGLASPSSLGKGATSGAGTLLAFATAPGDVALDGEGADSPFSLALARHISTPGHEVQQMLTRVRAEVVAATKGKQVPWSNSSLLGEVYLAGKPQ
jgi:tetratricopeptide (TPR) repeat protein